MTDENTKVDALGQSARILVVDDQEPFLKLFKRYYQETNYTIDTCSNPSKVLDLVRSAGDYHLLVLDVMMPGKTGYEVCAEIRKYYNMFELPVLFLTARTEVDSKAEGFAIGGNDYLTKPFEYTELIARSQTLVQLKKLHQENRKLINTLTDQNKFLQMNIHDLKSPLTSVVMLASMVQRDLIDDEENFNNLSTVINSSELMVSIVNEILEFNSLENKSVKSEFCPVGFTDVFSQVLDSQKPLATNKHQQLIVKQTNVEGATIMADSEKMVRAFSNIVGNAIKYTAPEKSIFANVLPVCNDGHDFLRVEITDQGPGFEEHEKSQVFSKFGRFSAKPTGNEKSTGLGLLIAKQLIELNNGKIWLDQENQQGSKFIIELPLIKV